jgi:hypothetical protein
MRNRANITLPIQSPGSRLLLSGLRADQRPGAQSFPGPGNFEDPQVQHEKLRCGSGCEGRGCYKSASEIFDSRRSGNNLIAAQGMTVFGNYFQETK